jgi:hypothetical protein
MSLLKIFGDRKVSKQCNHCLLYYKILKVRLNCDRIKALAVVVAIPYFEGIWVTKFLVQQNGSTVLSQYCRPDLR